MGFFQAEVGEMEASPAARRARVQTGPRALIGVKFPLLSDGERAGAAAAGGGTRSGGVVPRMCIGSCPCTGPAPQPRPAPCPHHLSMSPSPLRVPVLLRVPVTALLLHVPITIPRPCHLSTSPRALRVPPHQPKSREAGGQFPQPGYHLKSL